MDQQSPVLLVGTFPPTCAMLSCDLHQYGTQIKLYLILRLN